MPDGHKNHKAIGDFDIAALLSLINQCKHFKKFELGGLCEQVSHVRNSIAHSPHSQLKREDLQSYLHGIRVLGEALAKHDPEFESFSQDIDEIQNGDFMLVFPDNQVEGKILAEHDTRWKTLFAPMDEMRRLTAVAIAVFAVMLVMIMLSELFTKHKGYKGGPEHLCTKTCIDAIYYSEHCPS